MNIRIITISYSDYSKAAILKYLNEDRLVETPIAFDSAEYIVDDWGEGIPVYDHDVILE